LHLGGAWTALASWVVARRADGRSALRFEDLDTARCVRGARERLEDDLRWLGLDWGGAAVPQSEPGPLYEKAPAQLAAKTTFAGGAGTGTARPSRRAGEVRSTKRLWRSSPAWGSSIPATAHAPRSRGRRAHRTRAKRRSTEASAETVTRHGR